MPGKDMILRPAPPSPVLYGVPFPPPRGRESESAFMTIGRWVKRNGHLTVPLGVLPGMWLAGFALHQLHVALYAAPSAALLAGCVWFFAPHKWDRAKEQWYARLSAVLGAGWLIAAAFLNPAASVVTASVLGGILLAGCSVWGFFWWRHKRPRGQKKRARLIAQSDAWWQSHCHAWNLAGSHVIDAKLSGVTLTMRIQGLPGRHSVQQFRQSLHLIESAAEGQADIGRVRVQAVKGHPSQVDLFLKQENPLREVVEYDLSIAPESVHDPAPFGKLETAIWKMMNLRVNRFTIGATRTGKSNDLLVGIANLSGCPDARVVLIDLKGGRSARPVLKSGAAEYVITDVDEARMYLRMSVADIKARSMYAYDGNEQLTATVDVPAVFTMVDETYGLTATEDGAGDPECRRHVATMASQGSGLEYYEWIYTQNGSLETSVGTEQIRANLHHRTCYRVEEARHGAYVIPEYGQLDASKLEEKGTCYDKDGPQVTPEQVRAPKMEHELLTRIAAQNAALLGPRPRRVLHCGSEVAFRDGDRDVTWQEWWDTRWLRLHKAFHADSPQYQAALAADPSAAADVIETAQRAAAPVPSAEPGTGSAASAAARLAGEDAELMARVPLDFRPSPEMVARLPRIIASQEDRFAEALQAADASSPATPKDLGTTSERGRTWCHGQLGALAEIGYVTQITRGQYVPVPGMDIRQGMKLIKERNARLNREAVQKINAG